MLTIPRLGRMIALSALAAAALFLCPPPARLSAAEEEAERVPAFESDVPTADRRRLAKNILFHDFENRRNPSTGSPLPESADLDRDGWPDFWEPILAVGFPEYLINSVAIVPDRSPFVAGAYRDDDNHVLHMAFDGTRVGVRTSVPVPIDPGLAYEFSLRERDRNLRGAVIRAGVEWIRTDDAMTEYLRRDEIPDLKPGQLDWAAVPRRLLINDPPPDANAARFFIIVERDSEAVSVAHHGDVWFDDVRFKTHPKVVMNPVERTDGRNRDDPPAVDVEYSGLVENIPDPENPGFFKGRRYSRRVDVTDVFNRPLSGPNLGATRRLEQLNQDKTRERVAIPTNKFGVYYVSLRIYDADERLTAHLTRAVAVLRPALSRDRLEMRSGVPAFGVHAGAPPAPLLAASGFLRQALENAGVQHVKVTPWTSDYNPERDGSAYYTLLAEEVRRLRSSGIKVTGVIDPPSGIFGDGGLAAAMEEKPETLQSILTDAGRRLGLFMDSWQWGDDRDDSLYEAGGREPLPRFTTLVGEFAGGLPMTWNVRLDRTATGSIPDGFGIVGGYVPEREPARRLWQVTAKYFPWLYAPFFNARGAAYPPAELTALAPPPPADAVEAGARAAQRKGVWLTIDPRPAPAGEPDAAAERAQLEQAMIKAVYAAALGPNAIFLGPLFDPAKGLLRRDAPTARPTLETAARPTFLAASVLGEMLGGAQYLGPYELLPPFEAHAFKRPGGDQAVIVVWHNDSDGVRPLARSDIANGPPLALVDWAGNAEPLPSSVPVRRTPSFITGMSASMALTRMSVRVAPEPPMMAQTRRQSQFVEVVNHMPSQAPILFRLRYAARLDDGGMEKGWTVSPEELRANLAPAGPAFTPARLAFSAGPDPNSPVQKATRTGADKAGVKLAQVKMTLNTSPPADMTLYLRFGLKSDIDVDITELARNDDPHFVTLQLRVRWFPSGSARRRNEINLMPFYLRKGEMKESAALPVAVKASAESDRNKPDARYETMELRIPRNPPRQTWIGLTEEGGSNFYLADVTPFLTR